MASRVFRVLGTVLVLAFGSCFQTAKAEVAESKAAPLASEANDVRTLPGGAVLRVSPGTQLTLGRATRLQIGPEGRGKTLTHPVRLLSGRVEIELPAGTSKTPATAVLVNGPNRITALAKGGRSVVIAEPKRTTVAAVSGEMLVASGNAWRTIASGVVREFTHGSLPRDRVLLAAPRLELSGSIALRVGAERPLCNATAAPVPSAAGYDFGLWKVQGAERVLLHRLKSKTSTLEIFGLEAGHYGVTARAIESSGLESPESQMAPLQVVAADLPEGAKVSNREILLLPQERIRLSGTDNLEISYGRTPHFVPAPDSIGLNRGQPTLIRLRPAGSTEELALSLEPRTLRAEIQIGPRRARWPNDEISVSIRVTDSRGRLIAPSTAVKPIVHLNVTPIALQWKRAEGVFTTVVPRPTEPGPCVIRVEIKDDTGAVFGRDFLEVAWEEPHARR